VAKAEVTRLLGKNPENFTAYEYFLKGLSELYRYDKDGNKAARELFEKAKEKDPNFARVYAALAWTYELDYDFEWTDDYDGAVKAALENATTAVRLDPDDYQNHWALGWAQLYSWEHEKATASYMRARQMNPNDAELLAEMGNFLVYIGKPKQAVDQLRRAIELNPKHERWYIEYLGWAEEHAGMPKQAVETLEPVIDHPLTNEQLWLLPTLAAAYADPAVGRIDDARNLVKGILALDPEFSSEEFASRYPYQTKEQIDRYVKGLRQAGLPE
jgi:Tfp pilus assembly protein PilF